MTKRILCYGDSNTWGQVAFKEIQIPLENRWTTILGELLLDAEVISEGKCARIAGDFETINPDLNGQKEFKEVLQRYLPIDVVVISLGTNDLKKRYSRTSNQIKDDLLWYKDVTKQVCEAEGVTEPRVIYLTPPNFRSPKDYFDADDKIRTDMIELLADQSESVSINDLELSEDGVHISLNDHKRIAEELAIAIGRKYEK
jgi:lysophospholipase L1-like esterase